jgi:hypothetical protein
MAACIEALRDKAQREGQGGLAYLLTCAAIEARRIEEQRARDKKERAADLAALYRPRER